MGSSESKPEQNGPEKDAKTTTDEHFKNLKCDTCQKYLSVPPILSSSDGRVKKCGRESCNKKVNNNESLSRDLLFEELAKLSTFPCGVSKECSEKLQWGDVLNHESVCPYRQICCPKKLCNQKFQLKQVEEHFKKTHKDFLVEESKKCFFYYQLYSFRPSNELFLFKTEELQVLVYIFFKTGCSELKFNAFAVSPLKEPSKYSIKIDNSAGTGSMTMEYLVEIFPNTLACSKGDLTDVPLNTINVSNLTNNLGELESLFIDLKGQNSTSLANLAIGDVAASIPALLATFECPVCMNFMDSEIDLCSRGHSICGKCRSEINKTSKCCPECRAEFSENQRNFMLQEMAQILSSLAFTKK